MGLKATKYLKKGTVLFLIALGLDRIKVDFFSQISGNRLSYLDCFILTAIVLAFEMFRKEKMPTKK